MKNIMNKRDANRKYEVCIIGALAGGLIFILLYGVSVLNPMNDSWILNGYDESDVIQHYAGWVTFRNSDWSFPLGMNNTLAWPDGTIISFTDSLPWISILFKVFRNILPDTFQWFGLYIFACFLLHGCAGALLGTRGMSCGVYRDIFAFLSGILFACVPTLWERAFRHTALASQWLFLLALYFYLEYRYKYQKGSDKFAWQIPLLAFISVGIHPYFMPLVMMCALLLSVDYGRYRKRWKKALIWFGISLVAAYIGGIICGALGFGVNVSRDGYGWFSMNLNALINPYSAGGYTWSKVFPVLSQAKGQYDGFNYWGLGIIILLLASLDRSVKKAISDSVNLRTWWHRNYTVFCACVFLACFAVSNSVYFGTSGVEISLPTAIVNLCGIFRASSRMFYLVTACMLVYGVYSLRKNTNILVAGSDGSKKYHQFISVILMIAVISVQLWDLQTVIVEKHTKFQQEPTLSVVNSENTAHLGDTHSKLMCTESSVGIDRTLAVLAGKQNLTTNICIANSGAYPNAAQSWIDASEQLLGGDYDADTVYVTGNSDEWANWQEIFKGNDAVSLIVVCGYYFLIPVNGTSDALTLNSDVTWTLAELTDDNWTNGYSNYQNIVLFDRNDNLLTQLYKSTCLVCGDNEYEIIEIDFDEIWIRVTLNSDASDCMYPETILVK
ncbi:MAG: DUF6311 domain-containing protein [Lachnospiraceae bacterium]|nr:DUF6311 domain-containing protein [Lachnospiraceae bacterium]